MKECIQMTNITKQYGKQLVLNNLNLTLYPGKIIGLLGPNGSGKTTLFKTIMQIVRQQAGEIKICGEDVSYLTRKYISFMPDREFLYKNMTVYNAINYYCDMFEDFDLKKADELIQILNIDRTAIIDQLSKGNKEKVILMLTLARNVPIYLLDEPLGNLDPLIKHEMLKVIKSVSNDNNLIIISTHLIKDTEELIDQVIFLKNGQIAANFLKDDLLAQGKTMEQYYIEVFNNV